MGPNPSNRYATCVTCHDKPADPLADALQQDLLHRYLSSPTLSTELTRLSRGVLQTIVQLVTHAAAHAVECGEDRITAALLERAMIEPPLAAARQAALQIELRRIDA